MAKSVVRTHDTTSNTLKIYTLTCKVGRRAYKVKTVQYSLYWAVYHARDRHPLAYEIIQTACVPYVKTRKVGTK